MRLSSHGKRFGALQWNYISRSLQDSSAERLNKMHTGSHELVIHHNTLVDLD